VELALNILGSSMVLEKMEITPRREIRLPKPLVNVHCRKDYVDGHRVATELFAKQTIAMLSMCFSSNIRH
jgi:hypothetical protein